MVLSTRITLKLLGFGPEAPPPSGSLDSKLKTAMVREAASWTFRMRVLLYCLVIKKQRMNWDEFSEKLKSAWFRSYRNCLEARKSLGWAGVNPNDDQNTWLFGVLGYRYLFIGSSMMRHELFHAVQDYVYGLFSLERRPLLVLRVEYAAYLLGNPAFGIPVVWGGSIFVAGVVAYCIYTLLVFAVAFFKG